MNARPEWLLGGPWCWTSRENDCETIIRVQNPRDQKYYQAIIALDWADYDGDPKRGRMDAEELAEHICQKLNR